MAPIADVFPNIQILGFPRTEKWSNQDKNEQDGRLQKFVLDRVIDMNDP